MPPHASHLVSISFAIAANQHLVDNFPFGALPGRLKGPMAPVELVADDDRLKQHSVLTSLLNPNWGSTASYAGRW